MMMVMFYRDGYMDRMERLKKTLTLLTMADRIYILLEHINTLSIIQRKIREVDEKN